MTSSTRDWTGDTESPLLELFLTNRFSPVREILIPMLEPRDVLRLSQTRKDIRSVGKSLWDINFRLRPFFDDPLAFRSQMGTLHIPVFKELSSLTCIPHYSTFKCAQIRQLCASIPCPL